MKDITTTRYELSLISRIADRAIEMAAEEGIAIDKFTMVMDLERAHKQCPLQLAELMGADRATFGHDVFGIRRHMDRETGELGGCFLPRMAMPSRAAITGGE